MRTMKYDKIKMGTVIFNQTSYIYYVCRICGIKYSNGRLNTKKCPDCNEPQEFTRVYLYVDAEEEHLIKGKPSPYEIINLKTNFLHNPESWIKTNVTQVTLYRPKEGLNYELYGGFIR